jgi:hypothetical protein
VRKQYHFRPSTQGLYAWDVDRLIELAERLPEEIVPLAAIVELDSNYWFSHGSLSTVRAVVDHMRLVGAADLAHPIILDPGGGVMDGMHRVAKALLAGQETIKAKRLLTLPAPDYSHVHPDGLPY